MRKKNGSNDLSVRYFWFSYEQEEKERQLLIASGEQPREEPAQAIAAPLPPGPPPKKARTVDVNLALPEAQRVGAEPEQDFDFEA